MSRNKRTVAKMYNDNPTDKKTVKYISIDDHCQACSSNQYTGESNMRTYTESNQHNGRRNFMDVRLKGLSIWSILFIVWMNFFVMLTEGKGLQCYECLSLHCESGAVCDAIKSTMLEIFFPKRHFIHFDPNDVCPESELPMSSARWTNLSKECERSDSFCLASPIEVHTVVDAKKDGKQLEKEYTLTTHGYLLGCASRRILLEYPETMNVRVELSSGRNESNGGGKGASTGGNNPSGSGGSNSKKNTDNLSGDSDHRGNSGSKKQKQIFYNLTNAGNGAVKFDLQKKVYKDGYNITQIYSHVFYIDQGTKNATRCYDDNCNDKIKFRRFGNTTSGIPAYSTSSLIAFYSCLLLFVKLHIYDD